MFRKATSKELPQKIKLKKTKQKKKTSILFLAPTVMLSMLYSLSPGKF